MAIFGTESTLGELEIDDRELAGARIVLAGKGGVGKSTLTALLSHELALKGRFVLAIDADEQMNLAATLGVGQAEASRITPLALAGDYIQEKIGSDPDGSGGMLRLNPDVADVVDRLSIAAPSGIRLLVMGGVSGAGSGCLCPETSLLAATLRSMRLRTNDLVLMDTHAGLEHFGRSLAFGFDQVVVVAEPSFNAMSVAVRSALLAGELGIANLHLAVNRVRTDAEASRALEYLEEIDPEGSLNFRSVHFLPFDELALDCEPSVEPLVKGSSLARSVERLSRSLLETSSSSKGAR